MNKFLSIIIVGLMMWANEVCAQLTYQTLQVQYDSTWQFKNLALIPVRFKEYDPNGPANTAKDALTLSKAMQSGKLKFKEVSHANGADVNLLQVTNKSRQTVFIQGGDLLSGGKQDRVIAESKLLAPGQSDYINVYCIEKGRWSGKAALFGYAGFAEERLQKVMQTTARQQDIWKEIETQFIAKGEQTATWPYLQLKTFEKKVDSSYVDYFSSRLAQSDSLYAGFVAMAGDKIISCHLFATPHLTVLSFDHMLKNWVDAAESDRLPTVTNQQVQAFLDPLLKSAESQKQHVVGHGRLDVYNGLIFHLVAYP